MKVSVMFHDDPVLATIGAHTMPFDLGWWLFNCDNVY